jgi:hypothetical protein
MCVSVPKVTPVFVLISLRVLQLILLRFLES